MKTDFERKRDKAEFWKRKNRTEELAEIERIKTTSVADLGKMQQTKLARGLELKFSLIMIGLFIHQDPIKSNFASIIMVAYLIRLSKIPRNHME